MELGLPQVSDNALIHTLVKRRNVENDVKPIGTEHSNPLIDTRACEVEFIDGTTKTLTSNIIAKNLLPQVDKEGHRQLLLDDIIDYGRNGDAVYKYDTFVETRNGIRRRNITTKCWEICVRCKDRSMDWISLKDIKQSYQSS